MKKLVLFLLVLVLGFTLTSCDTTKTKLSLSDIGGVIEDWKVNSNPTIIVYNVERVVIKKSQIIKIEFNEKLNYPYQVWYTDLWYQGLRNYYQDRVSIVYTFSSRYLINDSDRVAFVDIDTKNIFEIKKAY